MGVKREKIRAKLRKILLDLISVLNAKAMDGNVSELKHCCSTMLDTIDQLVCYDPQSVDTWTDKINKLIKNI